MRIRLLQKAKQNLDEAMTYIAQQEDEETAQKLYVYIRTQMDSLLEHPHKGRLGRVVGTRELVLDKYPFIIPYRVKGKEIHILRVFHTSQNLPQRW